MKYALFAHGSCRLGSLTNSPRRDVRSLAEPLRRDFPDAERGGCQPELGDPAKQLLCCQVVPFFFFGKGSDSFKLNQQKKGAFFSHGHWASEKLIL